MKHVQGHNWTALRCVQWASAVSAVAIAIFLLSSSGKLREAVKEQLRERNLLRMRAATAEIHHYANDIRLCLELMAKYPQVLDLTPESDTYLGAVYGANFDQHRLQEIYVLEPGFDGRERPLRTFERGDDSHEAGELHTQDREAQEYAAQREQIRRFAYDPDLSFLISEPVDLCVGERGMVFSVPIRTGGHLRGVVAGMVPLSALADVLEESSIGNQLVLIRKSGTLVPCLDFPSSAIRWLQQRIGSADSSSFFADGEPAFLVGEYAALSTPVELFDGDSWRIASLYDEDAELAASGVGGRFTGPATALVVLMLGGVVVVLCGLVPALGSARNQADERARALGDREGRLRSVLNTAPDGIITIGEDGAIESFNAAAERLFGYSADEVMGRNVSVLARPPDAERHKLGLARYLRTGESAVIGSRRDVIGRRKDGTNFPLNLTVSEVQLADRRVFTGIARDITELRRADETVRHHSEILERTVKERTAELASAKERAEENDNAKTVFLANMSHELRTPLHSILSFAGFGLKRHESAGHQKMAEYFQMIDESGRTLLALLNDLLDLSKLESGATTFEIQPVNFHSLVRSVVAEFGTLASERRVRVRIQDTDSEVVSAADPTKMQQVFRNLLSNAVKFSPRGGLVKIAVERGNGTLVVSFDDEGPGIPENEVERIFDKFVQSSKTRTGAGGTGLGLAICRQIIAGHKGRIWVENSPDGGASVLCELPLRSVKRREISPAGSER